MIKHTILFFGLLVLVFLACSKRSSLPVAAEEPVVVSMDTSLSVKTEIVEEVIEPEKVYVLCEIQRSNCYGKCPAYTIKLFSDGKVIYHGKANVEKIGYYEAFCNPEFMDAIFTEAESINYFNLRSQYPTNGSYLPDLPKTTTYLNKAGLQKRIINNFDAPADLVHFENWLDQFFDDMEWSAIKS